MQWCSNYWGDVLDGRWRGEICRQTDSVVTDQVTFQENDGFSLHRNLYHDYDDEDDDDAWWRWWHQRWCRLSRPRHSCGFMPLSQFRHNRQPRNSSHFTSGVTSECQRYQQGINTIPPHWCQMKFQIQIDPAEFQLIFASSRSLGKDDIKSFWIFHLHFE